MQPASKPGPTQCWWATCAAPLRRAAPVAYCRAAASGSLGRLYRRRTARSCAPGCEGTGVFFAGDIVSVGRGRLQIEPAHQRRRRNPEPYEECDRVELSMQTKHDHQRRRKTRNPQQLPDRRSGVVTRLRAGHLRGLPLDQFAVADLTPVGRRLQLRPSPAMPGAAAELS